MDAETLRAILEAQTRMQQQMFSELINRMEAMVTASQPAVSTAPVSTAEFVTNSLSSRLPEFVYDPDNGCTFEVWYNRYEDKMPAPTDVSQLRAFLGLINFYGNFVKDLHDLRAPLDALTKKDAVYKWSP
ncbi:hypothetical protein COOONC_01930, partial [Cooperia oncophora]